MPEKSRFIRPPWPVTILAAGVLIFMTLQVRRAGLAISQADFLSDLPGGTAPLYFIVTGLVWAVLAMPLVVMLWFGAPLAPRSTKLAAWVFAGYYWIEQFLIMDNSSRGSNWPFLWTATLVIIAIITFVLHKHQFYFRRDV